MALTDANGTCVQTYEYSVYGHVAASDPNHPNPFMFTGQQFDVETGLYYYRARYYNPYLGRFLQTDPVGYEDGINWYNYCCNNPASMVDPLGSKASSSRSPPPWMQSMAVYGGLWAHGLPKPKYPGNWTSWKDFFAWYAYGEGQEVKLVDVGLLGAFRLSDQINPWVEKLQKNYDDVGEWYGKNFLSGGQNQASFTFTRHKDYDFTPSSGPTFGPSWIWLLYTGKPPLVVLGQGRLNATITISAERQKNERGEWMKKAKWTVDIEYSVLDWFKDPGDIGNRYDPDVEWYGCEPYRITANWSYVNAGFVFGPPQL